MSTWTTWARDEVGIGDLVALSVLGEADLVGRIVAAADGKIQCEVVRGRRLGTHVSVEPDQLLLRVHVGELVT